MRIDPATQHRRSQGEFARTLRGRQPRQDHARHQRFGMGAPPLLQVRNRAGLLTAALLLASARPVVAQDAPASLRAPALLPGACATRGETYTAVPVRESLEQLGNAAAASCLARPRQCPQILAGAALTALGSAAAGGWLGWRAGHHAGRAEYGNTPPPLPEAEAQVQVQFANTVDGLPAPLRFNPADIDPIRSPCDSLYAHINQRWHDTAVLPADQSRWDMPAMLQEHSLELQRRLAEQATGLELPTPAEKVVADLWTAGMNQHRINADGISPLRAELAAIDALQTPAAIQTHLHALTAAGLNPVFMFGVNLDMAERSTQIAYAVQGGLGLPDRSYYLTDDHAEALRAYRAHIAHVLRLAGAAPADAECSADAVMALERRFANASVPLEELNDSVTNYYHPLSVAEADALTPGFRWSALFQALGVDTPERFSLATPGFHQAVGEALTSVDAATWRAYLRFHTIDAASPYLSDDFVRAHHAFHARTLQGQDAMPPRWKQVLAAIERVAGEALGEMYVAVAFPAETRTRMNALVEQIGAALKRRLEQVPWMDADTRAMALRKADAFRPRIGHTDHWPDWSGLHTEACGYLRNLRLATAFAQRNELARLGAPPDPSQWLMTPQTVDAYHHVMTGEIAFSAAILQPPYFDPDADDALNYGAIGAVIGHEMAHAFSAESSRFGLDGGLQSWWSDADHQRYAALSAQLAAQFDQQQVDGIPLNGQLTASENLADLGGLAIAFEALRHLRHNQTDPMLDGLSQEERFFLSWGLLYRRLHTPQRLQRDVESDVHAIGAPRADVGPANLRAYAQAFNCPPGTPMTRSDAERVVYL
ncbi:M13 family metallopeptidase [Stenotrophomonas sp. AB1(2024)]|uniref:M13 family metallopeptidase n=1 Tax=Stenotrophomonas sp. AB1(2024) TaxID=3132215 RepID=UPI0030A99403